MPDGMITPKTQIIKIEEGPNQGKQVTVKKNMGHIRIMSQDLPEIKDWKVGQEYKLEVMVRQTSTSKLDKWQIEEGYGMPEDVEASFDIVEISLPTEQPPMKADPASTPDVKYL